MRRACRCRDNCIKADCFPLPPKIRNQAPISITHNANRLLLRLFPLRRLLCHDCASGDDVLSTPRRLSGRRCVFGDRGEHVIGGHLDVGHGDMFFVRRTNNVIYTTHTNTNRENAGSLSDQQSTGLRSAHTIDIGNRRGIDILKASLLHTSWKKVITTGAGIRKKCFYYERYGYRIAIGRVFVLEGL